MFVEYTVGMTMSVITSYKEYTVIIVRVVIVIARARQGKRMFEYRPQVLRRRRSRPVTGSMLFLCSLVCLRFGRSAGDRLQIIAYFT